MFLKPLDLTTALRPSYLPDEVLLFVQDNVGLYEGNFKLPDQQNGQVYLTSHRICYVDSIEPRTHSIAINLKDVERHEFYAGFLKSSAKVTIVLKPLKRLSLSNSNPDPESNRDATSVQSSNLPSVSATTWICTICSFSNPVPSNFDPAGANAHTPLAPCLACGIKPTLVHVLKAAISSSNRQSSGPLPSGAYSATSDARANPNHAGTNGNTLDGMGRETSGSYGDVGLIQKSEMPDRFQCPRCTFSNHPSLLSCEICGGPLSPQSPSSRVPPSNIKLPRIDSPGPLLKRGTKPGSQGVEVYDSTKLSFRGGGEKIFYERLKGSLTQRKWLLQNAPPPPKARFGANNSPASSNQRASDSPKSAGIAGLEQLGLDMRKNNEVLIGNAFEDLEALMASAKDIIALAESFARRGSTPGGNFSREESAVLAESASQLGLVTTKDIVGGGASESLYLSELSRNLAEFLTDDSRGVLKRAGGIMTLVDLWAMFNRARGGVELVSPMDFEKAARLWETLKLPVRLRTFRSGVMVVQGRDRTDETTIAALSSWLIDLHEFPPERDVAWDWQDFGMGVTAQQTAERFGWSLGVAEEELLMAEEQGAVCREEGIEGLKFWKNHIMAGYSGSLKTKFDEDRDIILANLREVGLV